MQGLTKQLKICPVHPEPPKEAPKERDATKEKKVPNKMERCVRSDKKINQQRDSKVRKVRFSIISRLIKRERERVCVCVRERERERERESYPK